MSKNDIFDLNEDIKQLVEQYLVIHGKSGHEILENIKLKQQQIRDFLVTLGYEKRMLQELYGSYSQDEILHKLKLRIL